MADEKSGSAPESKPALSVKGITETEYAVFVTGNPIAQMLFQFLRDYREALVRDATESWLNGNLTLTTEEHRRGFVQALDEITSIRIPEIATFYAGVKEAEAAAAEAERSAIHPEEEQEADDEGEAY